MIESIEENLDLLVSSDEENKKSEAGNSFSSLMKEKLNETNSLVKNAEDLTTSFALGELDNVHEVTIAAEKAKTAVNLTSTIQSQAVEAYKEIMRIQL
ncbi:MAG: flagellar hook-basal body complex protein FliE [Halanaerobiaceae bacterium]